MRLRISIINVRYFIINVSRSRNLEDERETESSLSGTSNEVTSRKFRSISELCETCQLVCFFAEPVSFEEVAKEEPWIKAMEEKMEMIEKNQTW